MRGNKLQACSLQNSVPIIWNKKSPPYNSGNADTINCLEYMSNKQRETYSY